MTTRSHYLLFHKRSTDWDSPLGYKQVISHYTRRISLLLTLVLGFDDILLVVGYNYNLNIVYIMKQHKLPWIRNLRNARKFDLK